MAPEDLPVELPEAGLVPAAVLSAEEVAVHRSAASWSVEEGSWTQLVPQLPADVIALLAPPVVVTARAYGRVGVPAAATTATVAAATTATVPAAMVPAATTAVAVAASDPAPRLLTPAPPVRRAARHRARA